MSKEPDSPSKLTNKSKSYCPRKQDKTNSEKGD